MSDDHQKPPEDTANPKTEPEQPDEPATSHSETSEAQTPKDTNEVHRLDDSNFQAEIQEVIEMAEKMRLEKMQSHRSREFMLTVSSIFLIIIGGGAFGWFFLVSGDLVMALFALCATILPPIFLSSWAQQPLKSYVKEYKTKFMPEMAQALGGLKFYANRGISAKILARTGIVPAHKNYKAEDFFVGKYKGVKLMMGEARLQHPNRKEAIFDGLFTLLELPEAGFQGHTVVTCDHKLAQRLTKKLKPISVISDRYKKRFSALSSKPEQANFLTEDFYREMAEMSDLFDKSELSLAFFKGKYIFVMIPYDVDMFEASNIFVPVATSDSAMRCKKEIEQLMSIIDILELYKGKGT